jgi:hypothetical protein
MIVSLTRTRCGLTGWHSTEAGGADMLSVSIIGAIVGFIVLCAGVGSYLLAMQTHADNVGRGELATIVQKVQSYENDHQGQAPVAQSNTWDTSFFSNTSYWPTQPIDHSCNCNNYAIMSDGNGTILIRDGQVKALTVQATRGLPKASWNGTTYVTSGSACTTSCTTLIFANSVVMAL